MIKVFLNRGEEGDILRGSPLVYDNEVSHVKYMDQALKWQSAKLEEYKKVAGNESGLKNVIGGALLLEKVLCEVYSKSGLMVGCGVINVASKIIVRLLSHKSLKDLGDPNDHIKNTLIRAISWRKKIAGMASYRVCFSESDGVPGFICDKYTDTTGDTYIVCMFSALSCEIFRSVILKTLIGEFNPTIIYERCDSHIRTLEGLPAKEGVLYITEGGSLKGGDRKATLQGSLVTTCNYDRDNFVAGENISFIIDEYGVKYAVDISSGQKTGHFLDQKDNRYSIRKYCQGKDVLDCFCHTGGFALNAFMGGAKSVIASDISTDALAITKKNIALNGGSDVISVKEADAFDALRSYENDGAHFDVIVLDPPAFTKNASNINKAYGGYKEINLRALKIINKGGIFITCSCSHFFDEVTFIDMLTNAARDAHRTIQILSITGAASDHPILLGYDRSRYLKCVTALVW